MNLFISENYSKKVELEGRERIGRFNNNFPPYSSLSIFIMHVHSSNINRRNSTKNTWVLMSTYQKRKDRCPKM